MEDLAALTFLNSNSCLCSKICTSLWTCVPTRVGGQLARCEPGTPAGDKRCRLASRRCSSLSCCHHSNPTVPVQSTAAGNTRQPWWIMCQENHRPVISNTCGLAFNLFLHSVFPPNPVNYIRTCTVYLVITQVFSTHTCTRTLAVCLNIVSRRMNGYTRNGEQGISQCKHHCDCAVNQQQRVSLLVRTHTHSPNTIQTHTPLQIKHVHTQVYTQEYKPSIQMHALLSSLISTVTVYSYFFHYKDQARSVNIRFPCEHGFICIRSKYSLTTSKHSVVNGIL